MKINLQSKLIAIIGGSGAGKTWLADRLQGALGTAATRLSLDDFYLDRSALAPEEQAQFNFDHPDAIDWPLVEEVLRQCRAGHPVRVPRYDFTTHKRLIFDKHFAPAPLVLVEGLWLLWQPQIHELFDLKIFIECPAQLRLARRISRDVAERGRSEESVRLQFWKNVTPMHDQFVAPQAKWANLIVRAPVGENGLRQLKTFLKRESLRVGSSDLEPSGQPRISSASAKALDPGGEIGFGFPDFVVPAAAGEVKKTDSRDGSTQPDLT